MKTWAMVALRVKLNGKLLCVAGAEDLSVLNTIVNAVGNLGPKTKKHRDEPPEVFFSVGGLTSRAERPDEHVRWAEQEPLKTGDKVEIDVLDTMEVDLPTSMRPFDVEREKERERERFEYAKEVYFSLRPKFEPQ
jgi:hypothetical protein